ncbi:hypothetical protein BH10BDE1_BH10BDE1_16790 [soil metagenome]
MRIGLRILATLLLPLLGANAHAAEMTSGFDQCVDGLYKQGGMSLRQAQIKCLAKSDLNTVRCQNRLFQKGYRSPEESFDRCSRDVHAASAYSGDLYQGLFQEMPSGSKKTVCTITVNSREEKESFQKLLPKGAYDFVELLPTPEADRFVTRDSFWLKRSCESQVRCDVLVISGHFAESFLGDSGFEISMSDLAQFKAKPICDRFFDSIKEVYLFGCNTLAGKKPDRRSIQQYVSILVEDGVAPHTAQRISARRYTRYDLSVLDKMRNIFSSASLIVGAPSVSPSGRNVQPTLDAYLSSTYQSDFVTKNRKEVFAETLGRSGFIVAPLGTPMPKVDGSQSMSAASKISSREDVFTYASAYGQRLPVPSLDLLISAKTDGLLSATDLEDIRSVLDRKWKAMSKNERRNNLCPLFLAGYGDWMPKDLNCMNDVGWLSAH